MHIILGIFYRLWVLLEGACHQLDLELAIRGSPTPTDRESFHKYSALIKQMGELSEKKAELTQLVSSLNAVLSDLTIKLDSESHPLFRALQEEVHSQSKRLKDLVWNKTNMYIFTI